MRPSESLLPTSPRLRWLAYLGKAPSRDSLGIPMVMVVRGMSILLEAAGSKPEFLAEPWVAAVTPFATCPLSSTLQDASLVGAK